MKQNSKIIMSIIITSIGVVTIIMLNSCCPLQSAWENNVNLDIVKRNCYTNGWDDCRDAVRKYGPAILDEREF